MVDKTIWKPYCFFFFHTQIMVFKNKPNKLKMTQLLLYRGVVFFFFGMILVYFAEIKNRTHLRMLHDQIHMSGFTRIKSELSKHFAWLTSIRSYTKTCHEADVFRNHNHNVKLTAQHFRHLHHHHHHYHQHHRHRNRTGNLST